MRDLTKGYTINDEDVVFYDGFLYIISCINPAWVEEEEYHEPEYSIDVLCLSPEHDEPLSLKDIVEKYPNVEKLLYEDCLKGKIYNYGNHGDIWEKTGETLGYV